MLELVALSVAAVSATKSELSANLRDIGCVLRVAPQLTANTPFAEVPRQAPAGRVGLNRALVLALDGSNGRLALAVLVPLAGLALAAAGPTTDLGKRLRASIEEMRLQAKRWFARRKTMPGLPRQVGGQR
jgi:hypothetical protein